jgi:DNA-binding beta-propeller fold protein YncE
MSDYSASTVRRVSTIAPYYVKTIAGSYCVKGNANGDGSSARFNNPYGVCYDGLQYLYMTDNTLHTIRKIDTLPPYAVTTVAGTGVGGYVDGPGSSAKFCSPFGICHDGSRFLYVCDGDNCCVRKIDTVAPYTVTTLTGKAGRTGKLDSTLEGSLFGKVYGCYFDKINNYLYVVDNGNNRIRQIRL